MNDKAKRILENAIKDDDPKAISIVFKDLSVELSISNGYLTDFAISQGFNTEIYGDEDSIEIVYPYGKRAIRIDVESNAEENDNLLEEFNKEVTEKYLERLISKKLSVDELRQFVSSLLDYINSLTDKRANEIIQKIKELLRGELLEFNVVDVVEVFGDDDIDDEEG